MAVRLHPGDNFLNLRSPMIDGNVFREMALSFPNTEEAPHFDRVGFKVTGRRMFASYLAADNTANVFLTPKEQKLFCETDPDNIYPVANKWGIKGATTFVLDRVARETVSEALLSAYNEVARQKRKK